MTSGPRALSLALAATLLGAPGCDALGRLRAFFDPKSTMGDGTAALRAVVSPTQGLRATLDGTELPDASPVEAKGLRAGTHVLALTAPEHHPFTVAFPIAEHQVLDVAIALRSKPATAEPQRERALRAPEPMEEPPVAPAAALPPGVPPITLQLVGQPELAVQLDGASLPGKEVKLERVSGTLKLGSAQVRFRIASAGLLELSVPDDRAQWFKDGEVLEPNTGFFLHKGTVRLQQIAANGDAQLVLIRRDP